MSNNNNNTKKVTTSIFCRQLLNNAKYTDNNHFISKTQVGDENFKQWLEKLAEVKHNAFLYYEALANEKDTEACEKAVYTSLKSIIALIGEIPTSDGKESTKINSAVLFNNAVTLAVKLDSKIEVKKLVEARDNLRLAKKNYRENCLTDKGFVKNGLSADYVKAFTDSIEKYQKEVDNLLSKANNSVFGTSEVKISTFAKKFEIQLRKEVTKKHGFTSAEAKAEKQKQKQTRKQNRSKATTKNNG